MCVSWLFRGNSIWLSRLPFSCLVKNSITRSDDYLWLFTEIASSALGQCVVGTLSAVPSCQVIDTLLSAPRFVSIQLILYAEMGKTEEPHGNKKKHDRNRKGERQNLNIDSSFA